jgi:hypothetical protein
MSMWVREEGEDLCGKRKTQKSEKHPKYLGTLEYLHKLIRYAKVRWGYNVTKFVFRRAIKDGTKRTSCKREIYIQKKKEEQDGKRIKLSHNNLKLPTTATTL